MHFLHPWRSDVGNAKGLLGAILALRRPYGPDPVAVPVLGYVEGGWGCYFPALRHTSMRGDDGFLWPSALIPTSPSPPLGDLGTPLWGGGLG